MKIAQLLAHNKGGAAAIREAIRRAEEAGREAAGRFEELTRQRIDTLLRGDERALDRVEAALREASRDLDRADLAVAELGRRLAEAETAERQALLDQARERGLAATRRAASLTTKEYARLATQLRDVVVEMRAAAQEVAAVNAELEKGGDPRRVPDPDSIARPDGRDGEPTVGDVPIWARLVLPSPTHRLRYLYPATDLWGSALESAA
jgi:hypothetical protein